MKLIFSILLEILNRKERRYRGGELYGLRKLHGSPTVKINPHSVRYGNSGAYKLLSLSSSNFSS